MEIISKWFFSRLLKQKDRVFFFKVIMFNAYLNKKITLVIMKRKCFKVLSLYSDELCIHNYMYMLTRN